MKAPAHGCSSRVHENAGTIPANMKVLVVEDELRMASLIRRGLVTEGLAADVAPSG